MYRNTLKYLKNWKDKEKHKPLIVRGARQVGKSYLIREFGRLEFEQTIEINFEKDPTTAELFSADIPKTIRYLEMHFQVKFVPGKTLLFLDEIQSAPQIIPILRYFHEDMPDLHVVTAGSLLEFVLSEHAFSMPVGRVEYLHMGSMTFEEFLQAGQKEPLFDFLQNYNIVETIPLPLHKKLMDEIKNYILIGGMPEAVAAHVNSHDLLQCDQIKSALVQTYIDDFSKYGKKVDVDFLKKTFQKIPAEIGQKVKYVRFSEEPSYKVANALEQLGMAKVCERVFAVAANGVPLAAEIHSKIFKLYFLDVGLVTKALGVGILDQVNQPLELINKGKIAEQFVAQHLLYFYPPYEKPALYYWCREQKNSNAEVDFLISMGREIIPVEVKSGKTGRLRSLQVFLAEKKRDFAVRFNSDFPSLVETDSYLFELKKFRLLSLPFYLIGQLERLIRAERKNG